MNRFRVVGRVVATLVLSGGALAVFSIMALSLVVCHFCPNDTRWSYLGITTIGVLMLAVPVAAIVSLLRGLSARWLCLASVPLVLAFIWLAWDEPEAPRIPDARPVLTSDDTSYLVMMWMGRNPELARPPSLNPDFDAKDLLPKSTASAAEWWAHIRTKSSVILQAWNDDTLGREWVDLLDRMPPAGVWPIGFGLDIPDFKPIRTTLNVRLAYAYLLATQGRRDDGVRLVLPLIRVMSSFERNGGTIVASMIGNVGSLRCLRCISAILELGALSREVLAELRQVLLAAPSATEILDNAYRSEEAFFCGMLARVGDGVTFKELSSRGGLGESLGGGDWVDWTMRICGPLLYNPHQTQSLYVRNIESMLVLARKRDIAAIEQLRIDWAGTPRFANPVGRLLVGMGFPECSKVVKAVWEKEDSRQALLCILEP